MNYSSFIRGQLASMQDRGKQLCLYDLARIDNIIEKGTLLEKELFDLSRNIDGKTYDHVIEVINRKIQEYRDNAKLIEKVISTLSEYIQFLDVSPKFRERQIVSLTYIQGFVAKCHLVVQMGNTMSNVIYQSCQ